MIRGLCYQFKAQGLVQWFFKPSSYVVPLWLGSSLPPSFLLLLGKAFTALVRLLESLLGRGGVFRV